MAYRLSADPRNRVLLVEAGGRDSDPLIPMPVGIAKTLANPELCWYYPIEPEPGNANEPRIFMRGKVLGGSSSVNGMVYCRGQLPPSDHFQLATTADDDDDDSGVDLGTESILDLANQRFRRKRRLRCAYRFQHERLTLPTASSMRFKSLPLRYFI